MSAGIAQQAAPAYLPDITDFEAGAIDARLFDHRAHLHVGWCYLRQYPLAEAIARFTAALRALTLSLGAEGKYHETVSWFFMIVIGERLADAPAGDWKGFRNANPDLFGNAGDLLRRHYSPECLASGRARERFVLPDRVAASTDRRHDRDTRR